jgi:hypothetical protein
MARVRFKEADMYAAIKSNLRAKYPANQGWKIFGPSDKRKDGYAPDFVVERTVTKGLIFIDYIKEKIIVEAKAEAIIKQGHLDQINSYSRNHSGKNVRILAKILVIPSGTDVKGVRKVVRADGIYLMWLKNFRRN